MFKVLIAEDEYLERQVLKQVVDQKIPDCVVVGEATTGMEAVEMARTFEPHIILMDIKMPVLDGLRAAQIIKEEYPATEIVFLTAYGKFSYSHQAIKVKAADYLLKPVESQELIRAMEQILTRWRGHCQNMSGVPAVSAQMEQALMEDALKGDMENVRRTLSGLLEEVLAPGRLSSGHNFVPLFKELTYVFAYIAAVAGADPRKISATKESVLKGLPDKISTDQLPQVIDQISSRFLDLIGEQVAAQESLVVTKAKSFIKKHYQTDLTLGQVASAVHVSPSYLSKIFKNSTGQSFVQYLTKVRLEKAKQLLRNYALTVDQIADQVGFGSNSYFAAVFKKYEGMTPSQYRDAALLRNKRSDD